MRVTIVDSDTDVRRLIRRYLHNLGYLVIEYRNGWEFLHAVELSVESIPDLILLDVFILRSEDWEIARRLKTTPSLQSIPLLLMTTLISENSVRMAQEIGAVRILAKPFQWDAFQESIQAYASNVI